MNVNVTLESGLKTVAARLYTFPKKGNAPEDYTLTVNGVPAKVAMTGGGAKYPRYVYVVINGVSHYLPANVVPVSGSDVVVPTSTPEAEAKLKEMVGDGGVEVAKALPALGMTADDAVKSLESAGQQGEEAAKPKKTRVPKAK